MKKSFLTKILVGITLSILLLSVILPSGLVSAADTVGAVVDTLDEVSVRAGGVADSVEGIEEAIEDAQEADSVSDVLSITSDIAGNLANGLACLLQGDCSGSWSGLLGGGGGNIPTGSLEDGLDSTEDTLSNEITQNESFRTYVLEVVNFILGFLGLLAILMIIYAGFLYVTSGVNKDGVEKAKSIITYAVVGIFVILASYALVNTVINFKDEGGNGGGTIRLGTSVPTVKTSTASGVTNGVYDLNAIMDQLVPMYRERYRLYRSLHGDILPNISNWLTNLRQMSAKDTAALGTIVSNVSREYETLKKSTLSDFMKNEKLKNISQSAVALKNALAMNDGLSMQELETFILATEYVLYGASAEDSLLGQTGSPTATLQITSGEYKNGKRTVIFNGQNSSPAEGAGVSRVVIDFDIEVDTSSDGVTDNDPDATATTLSEARFSSEYAPRSRAYRVAFAIFDTAGNVDTVIRSFYVKSRGATNDEINSDDDTAPDKDDNCPTVANGDQLDGDKDGVGNACDNCPTIFNSNQADNDNNGTGNVCDYFDYDSDGVLDNVDNCPVKENEDQADTDKDGVGDVCDNCSAQFNSNQADNDDDGIGNVCEPDYDTDFDLDADGINDNNDNCYRMPNPEQLDSDRDGIGNTCDNCPTIFNSNQADTNSDGVGNACESFDYDSDKVVDSADNCPRIANADQADADGDGVGDACDNCKTTFNSNQADADDDGIGNVCDTVGTGTDGEVVIGDDGRDEGLSPFARLSVSQDATTGNPLSIMFDPSSSVPASGATFTSYYIDTDMSQDSGGDGVRSNDADLSGSIPTAVSYTYKSTGTYRVKLVVRDSFGNQDSVVLKISVNNTGLTDIDSENDTDTRLTISGLELLDYVRYRYDLTQYNLDLVSIQDALAEWYETSVPHTASVAAAYSEMTFALKNMIDSADDSNNAIDRFSKAVVSLLEEIARLPVITPKITAKPATEGKAPLTVEFSGVNSRVADNSEINIDPEGYCWYGIDTNEELGITHEPSQSPTGPIQTVTFAKPGNYAVRLDIPANGSCSGKSTSKTAASVVSGSTTINVKVEQPSTAIGITITPPCRANSAENTEYEDNPDSVGVSQLVNGQTCYISLDDAKSGVLLDPTSSIPSSGRSVVNAAWEIGNKRFNSYASLDGARISYTDFKAIQTYPVIFTTTDNVGEKDEFRFNVEVVEILADISITPARGSVDTEYKFSADNSETSGASIVSYEWTINKIGNEAIVNNSDKSEFTHKFAEPGTYVINLGVTDSKGRQARTTRNLVVVSDPPVAKIVTTQKAKNRPGTYIFDVTGSYDPDSTVPIKCSWKVDGQPITIIGGNGECSSASTTSALGASALQASVTAANGTTIQQTAVGMFEYTFASKGRHEVELTVEGDNAGKVTKTQVMQVSSVLGVDFEPRVEGVASYTAQVGDEMYFVADAPGANSYDWNFGDKSGSKTTSDVSVSHTYNKSGTYSVTLTAFNAVGDSNKIVKKIVIGARERAIAQYDVLLEGININNQVDGCGSDVREIYRNQTLTFNAQDSRNSDGTRGNLEYSWEMGEGGAVLEGMRVSYRFDELSKANSCYNVLLTVRDKNNAQIRAEDDYAGIRIVNAKPRLSDLRVKAITSDYVTPFTVYLTAVNAKDLDGKVSSYRWWYYTDQDQTKQGTQETLQASTSMVVKPVGNEGEKMNYYFVVELEDNEGGTTKSTEVLGSDPMLEVVTGQNPPPVAYFTADKVSGKVGDEIHFIAKAKNSLNEVMPKSAFWWDFDGDRVYDDKTSGTYASHIYKEGGVYIARLKVSDGGNSSTYEMQIRIKSDTAKPQAAFIYTANGTNISFINNSQVDPKLGEKDIQYRWDFDGRKDTDGDGDKKNDADAIGVNPKYTYTTKDLYEITLQVTDSVGATDVVRRTIDLRDKTTTTKGTTSTGVSTTVGTSSTTNAVSTCTGVKDAFGNPSCPVVLSSNAATMAEKVNIDTPTVKAVVETTPARNAYDKIIYLKSGKQNVTFDFSKSVGQIVEYRLDRNIYYDTDKDGNPENDVENRSNASFTKGGKWTTSYDSTWAPATARLTVLDKTGKKDSEDVVFQFGTTAPAVTETASQIPVGALVASFATDPEMAYAQKEITFDASSSVGDFARYVWDFNGDGEVDEDTKEKTTNFTYDQMGDYTVTLLAITADGEVSEYNTIVSVVSPASAPVADFDYALDGLAVEFHNKSTVDPAIQFHAPFYTWKFYEDDLSTVDDTLLPNVTEDSSADPYHVFAKAGKYRVVLEMEDYYGQAATTEKEITVTEKTAEETAPEPVAAPEEENTDEPATPTDEETTPPVVEQSEDTTPDAGGSIFTTILKILLWIVAFAIIGVIALAIVVFNIFQKKYPGHSFQDFMEYVQMTLRGEDYGPGEDELKNETKIENKAEEKEKEKTETPVLEKAPEKEKKLEPKPAPVAPAKPAPEPKKIPEPKPAPAPAKTDGATPSWLGGTSTPAPVAPAQTKSQEPVVAPKIPAIPTPKPIAPVVPKPATPAPKVESAPAEVKPAEPKTEAAPEAAKDVPSWLQGK